MSCAWSRKLQLTALALFILAAGPADQATQCPRPPMMAVVARVVDGDTVVLASGERIRYIGIDCPEVHHPHKPKEPYGEEATEVNRRLVEGRSIALFYDREERDRYGRLLAYVIVDDTFVNAKMVREGYARTMTIPPNTAFQPLFEMLESEARASGKGIWNETGSKERRLSP